jgi:DNA topoisomerase-2
MSDQSSNDQLLASKYQQKTDKAHILDNPDTYIGSVEHIDSHVWIFDEEMKKIVEKNINYIPGLFKLFDEGIVNCRDHAIRMASSNAENAIQVSYIDVSIENGTITMTNDGNGIDIAKHPETGIWIPEMIFGHLRTSTNYDKTEKKIVGGKNGFGFKLVLIWSVMGTIETVDHTRGLKYTQTFRQNLDIIDPPVITKCKGKPYTKITFHPDYTRLGIPSLTPDMIALFKKRVYDISAVTDKSLKVRYNGETLATKNFQQYIDLYIGNKDATPRVYEETDPRWEYAVALSPSHEFIQISFVNGIHTCKGGKHVEFILNQITRKMIEFIEKKKKIKVNANSIKEQLMLFVRCDIENPAFDSQTKDFMNTPVAKFGSSCTVSDKFIEKVAKLGVMDAACAINDIKEHKAAKKMDGSKTKNIRGIPKLMDANLAGTDKSRQCILILCEGDSAKAGIVSGLSSEDRNIIGVYPLKGKVMNVRGELTKRISENKEITEIKQILGLEKGKQYLTMDDVASSLRYGKVLFLTDQDADGSHIKGLCVNLFQSEWSSLIRIPGFIGFMNTPILKARRGQNEMLFYNDGEYNLWKSANNDGAGWNVKYYKGLGTSTGKEFKEYFEHKKIVNFTYAGDGSDDAIDMVFNKKRADDRKGWLEKYDRESYVDTSNSDITYEEFIHKELIHFSKYDCDRSIPNLMDGLKISLRKILYSAFKKNLTSEIKVAQFSGYVSEHSCYHHGEASLNQAIVGMAQNFVGSNNINLLVPSGQFGTRMQGGKDSASERYIFTLLSKITRCLFPQDDDSILTYLSDDGFQVEPTWYAPIIPMVLVNGSKGIGTGFSTEIMCYNPLDIIAYIKCKLREKDTSHVQFIPYYEGFNGQIVKLSDSKYLFKGRYERVGNDKIRVTELPVGFWTQDFKEMLEEMTESTVDKAGKKVPPLIRDYDDMSKDTTVDFTITFPKDKLDELESNSSENGNGVEKLLKLCSTSSTTNMHLFNEEDKLKKYASVPEIIDDYYKTRLELYGKRKLHLMDVLERELMVLSNKARYIQEILNDTIDLRRKKKDQVIEILRNKKYNVVDGDVEYKYLTKMSMDSVTEENVAKIMNERDKKAAELEIVRSKPIVVMWEEELVALETEYLKYREERNVVEVVKPTKKQSTKRK